MDIEIIVFVLVYLFIFLPVEEEISLLVGAATQWFTDDVLVTEWR